MNENEIQNFVVHNTSSGIAKAGALILDGTLLKYHNGSGYVTLGDSDVATSSAAGVVKLFNDTDVTESNVNSVTTTSSRWYGVQLTENDKMVVNVPWVNTNTNTFRTVSVDTNGDGSVDDTLTGSETLVLKKGSNITLSESGGVITISSTDTNTQLNNAGVIGKVLTGLSTASGGTVAAADTILEAFGKLENRVALNDVKVTNTNNSAATIRTLIGSGNNGHVPTAGNAGEFLKHDGTFGTPSYIANTDVDVSVDNLKTRLAGGFASNAVTIGDSDDVVTIGNKLIVTGDLQVDGTTTTLNTATLDVEDLNITVAKGAADAAAADGAGLTVDGASATLLYRNTNDNFIFNKRLDATSFHGPLTGNVTGNADTVTTNANLSGHITSSGNTTSLGSFTVAQLSTALSDASISGNNTGDGTYGIADTNYVKIDSSSVADDEYARFTANGLESRSTSEVLSDIGAVAANSAITGSTKAKITFDAKGLVTGGADLASGDIPNNAADTTGSSASCTGNAATATVLASGAVGGVKVVHLDHSDSAVSADQGSSNSTIFTITHGMGASRFYKVEVVQDSGNYDTVYVDVTRPSDSTIVVTFGAAVANGAYRAMITRMA